MSEEAIVTDSGEFAGMGAENPASDPMEEKEAIGTPQGEASNETEESAEKEAAPHGAVEKDPEKQPASEDEKEAAITDWDKVELNLDGFEPDPEILKAFGGKAVELGLTKTQAETLTKWQLETIQKAHEAMLEKSLAQLKEDWGANAGKNQQAVISLIEKVDRMNGNDSFSRAITACGGDINADFVKGLLALSSLTAEDSLQGKAGESVSNKKETAEEGLDAIFRAIKK